MRYIFIAFFIISLSLVHSITVIHQDRNQIEVFENELILEIDLIGDVSLIHDVVLFYRWSEEHSYNSVIMENILSERTFQGRIPNLPEKPTILNYYFELVYTNGDRAYYPERGLQNPFITRVSVSATEYANKFIKLLPERRFVDDDFIIAISFWELRELIDISSVSLFINNRKVRQGVTVASNMLTYRQKFTNSPNYSFYVTAKTKHGNEVRSKTWVVSNITESKFALPFQTQGSFRTVGSFRETSTGDDKNTVKNASLEYRIRADIDDFTVENRMFFSDNETKRAQPVNRYFLGMNYKAVSLFLGDYSPNLSRYTINNVNVRGAHTRFNFPGFRFFLSYGFLNRAVDGKETFMDDEPFTTAGTFHRHSLSFRTEVGRERTLFQRRDGVLWGLNVVKNKDRINSIDEIYYRRADGSMRITPKDNLIVSTDLSYTFLNRKLVLGGEAAISMYNHNIIDGVITKDSLEVYLDESFPFDPENFENIFIINKNVEPLLPGRSNLAFETFIRAVLGSHNLRLSYSEVGAAYNSLSTFSLKNDSRTLSLSDNIRLLSNRLNVTLGANISSDNLSKSKSSTTKNFNYYGHIFYNPANLPIFNLGMGVTNSENDSDTIDQSSNYFHFGVSHYLPMIEFAPSNVSLTYRFAENQDSANEFFNNQDNSINLNIRSDLAELPLRTTFSYGFRAHNEKQFNNTYNMNSIGLGAELLLLENRLIPFAEFRISNYDQDSALKNFFMFKTGANYLIYQNTSVNADLTYSNNSYRDKESDATDFLNMRVVFNQRF